MTLQNSGLNNSGLTQNFQVEYQDTFYTGLPPSQATQVQDNLIANANYLLGVVEGTFNTTTGWFGTDITKFGTAHPQQVYLNGADGTGATNNGYGKPINVDSQSQNATIAVAGPEVAMVWVNEWAEILMSLTNGQWNSGDSSGEGLSQYTGIQLFPVGHYDYYGSWVDNWLNGTGTAIVTNQHTASPNAARSDWVNTTFTGATVGGVLVHGDGDPVSFGCALGFIYYLTVQLSFTINQVISNYSGNLASCYHTLTGDSSDPFPIFSGLLASVYPAGTTASIPGPVSDNPFPIAEVQFYDQKNTFGKDETQDIINGTLHGLVSSAFWVVINGFSQHSFQTLGIQVGSFTGSFATLQGVKITPNPAGAQFENGVNSTTPQTISIPFDITLSTPILGQFPPTGVSAPYGLSVSLTSGGTTVTGSQASTEFELIAKADPYFSNIDPSQDNQPYLSQDLRVFNAAPAISNVPFPGGPAFATDSVTGAYSYITALLGYLNGNSSFTTPNVTDPFSLLPAQQDEGQTDSSVAPFAFNFTNPLQPSIANNYNFAIARVRLRGTSGSSGAADNVRVFFRVFGTVSNDTDFDPNGTYFSTPDTAGEPGTPQPGTGNTTIPFFATNNPGSETDYQPGGLNNQTLTIPNGQDTLWWYFGCFLNFYDPTYKIAGQQIQAYLPGTHHCLVAQIAYDDAPIPTGVSPLSWDQLAQRNLQFTAVDNPGPAATHRAPQTFDCRPSGPIGQPDGSGLPPDELMIDWGNVPKGTLASLYWPAVLAAEVIALARQWGSGTAPFSASDAHTLTIPVDGGISYIPIPSGSGQNFAGLFTLEMPLGIRTGQEFDVVVRRISTKRGKAPPPPPPPPPPLQSPPSTRLAGAAPAPAGVVVKAVVERTLLWRYVVGSFVVRIPVSTSAAMLAPEAMTLAIMKWRLAQLSPGNRWVPVLQRYIAYCSARLDGVGGDASQVPASLTWVPPQLAGGGKAGEPDGRTRCGKVAEVLFDCHGDFCGFVLDECCARPVFETRERAIGELVLRACHDGMRLCVTVDGTCGRIVRLAVTA